MKVNDLLHTINVNDAIGKIKALISELTIYHGQSDSSVAQIKHNYVLFVHEDKIAMNIPSYANDYLYLAYEFYEKIKNCMPGELPLEERDALIINAMNQCGVYNLKTIRDTQDHLLSNILVKHGIELIGIISTQDIPKLLIVNQTSLDE